MFYKSSLRGKDGQMDTQAQYNKSWDYLEYLWVLRTQTTLIYPCTANDVKYTSGCKIQQYSEREGVCVCVCGYGKLEGKIKSKINFNIVHPVLLFEQQVNCVLIVSFRSTKHTEQERYLMRSSTTYRIFNQISRKKKKTYFKKKQKNRT